MTGSTHPDELHQQKVTASAAAVDDNRQFAEQLAAIWTQATPRQRQEIVDFIKDQLSQFDLDAEVEKIGADLAGMSPPAWQRSNSVVYNLDANQVTADYIRQKYAAGLLSLRVKNAVLRGLVEAEVKCQPDATLLNDPDYFLAILKADQPLPFKGVGPVARAKLRQAFSEELKRIP